MKLSKMEQAAQDACAEIVANGQADFTLERVRNATWGYVARIKWRGQIAARASGCGYDKTGACVANFLRPLGHGRNGAAGIPALADGLKEKGWILESVWSGEREAGFRISRAVAV